MFFFTFWSSYPNTRLKLQANSITQQPRRVSASQAAAPACRRRSPPTDRPRLFRHALLLTPVQTPHGLQAGWAYDRDSTTRHPRNPRRQRRAAVRQGQRRGPWRTRTQIPRAMARPRPTTTVTATTTPRSRKPQPLPIQRGYPHHQSPSHKHPPHTRPHARPLPTPQLGLRRRGRRHLLRQLLRPSPRRTPHARQSLPAVPTLRRRWHRHSRLFRRRRRRGYSSFAHQRIQL